MVCNQILFTESNENVRAHRSHGKFGENSIFCHRNAVRVSINYIVDIIIWILLLLYNNY